MSARGFLSLGTKTLAESKQLIPIAWLGFLTPEHIETLISQQPIELDRKVALANFDLNSPFLSKIASALPFDSASESLIAKVRSSRAKTLTINILELINFDGPGPKIGDVLTAIAEQDAKRKFSTPSTTAINPATGEEVRIPGIKFNSTIEALLVVCWIQPDDLNQKRARLVELVIGYIWDK